jgi:hypothetical protein
LGGTPDEASDAAEENCAREEDVSQRDDSLPCISVIKIPVVFGTTEMMTADSNRHRRWNPQEQDQQSEQRDPEEDTRRPRRACPRAKQERNGDR